MFSSNRGIIGNAIFVVGDSVFLVTKNELFDITYCSSFAFKVSPGQGDSISVVVTTLN